MIFEKEERSLLLILVVLIIEPEEAAIQTVANATARESGDPS